MANYQPAPPFFGRSYPMPLPPPPNVTPASFQNQPPQSQQQPPPPSQQPQAQSAAAFQQNASLPHQMDFTTFSTLFNNGTLPPPVFPPPFAGQPGFLPPPPIPFPGFQPPALGFPVPPPQAMSVPQLPPTLPVKPAPPAHNNRVSELVGDKEEGELSDDVRPKAATDYTASNAMRSGVARQGEARDQQLASGDRYRPGAEAASPRGYGLRSEIGKYDRGSHRDEYRPESSQMQRPRDGRSPVSSSRELPHRSSRGYDTYRPEHDRAYISQYSKSSNQQPSVQSSSAIAQDTKPEERSSPNGEKSIPLAKQREESIAFVKVLKDQGYGFADLVKENLDPKLLGEIFVHLSKISPRLTQAQPVNASSNAPPPQVNAHAAAPVGNAAGISLSTSVKPVQATAPAVRSSSGASPLPAVPVAAAPVQDSTSAKLTRKPTVTIPATKPAVTQVTSPPVDRAEYIKRLMAAKSGKASSTAQPPAPPAAVPEKAPVAPQVQPTKNASSAPKPNAPAESAKAVDPVDPGALAAQKKAAQNELLRKKIEALKLPRQKPAVEQQNGSANQSTGAQTPATINTTETATPPHDASSAHAVDTNAVSVDQKSPAALPSAVHAQSPRGIPGLFMTSTEPQSQASNKPAPAPAPAAPINQGRKRPVAADFEDMQRATPSMFKRPFGQSRYENDHQDLIIEVSDDESEGSDMDVDDDLEETQPAPVAAKSSGYSQTAAARNLPPLTDFPSRPNFGQNGSTQATTPAVQTPGTADDLRRKEEELAALKKKLAERQLQQKAKLQSSRASTPVMAKQSAPASAPQSIVATPPSATYQANEMPILSHADQRSAHTGTSPAGTAAPAAKERSVSLVGDRSSVSQSPAESEWRRRRRAELQSSIFASEAGLSTNLSRLEQLKREMEQIEAENRKRQLEKEQLIDELEGLGIDTEGMPHEELQAKKNEIMQQQESEAANLEASKGLSQENAAPESQDPITDASRQDVDMLLPAEAKLDNVSQVPTQEAVVADGAKNISEGEVEDESDTTDAEMEMSDSEAEDDYEPSPVQPLASVPAVEPVTGESVRQLSKTVNADPKPALPAESSEQEDTEDFYSPEPSGEAAQKAPGGDAAAQVANDSPYSFGDSQEDDDITARDENMDTQEPPKPAPTDIADAESDVAMDEDEDDYEPSDAIPEAAHAASSAPTSEYPTPRTKSPADLTGLEPAQLTADTQATTTSEPTPAVSASASEGFSRSPPTQVAVVADDLAPELQPPSSQELQPSQTALLPSEPAIPSRFTPYESPLKQFRAYRYHPEYSRSVPGGFRSLTYSHEIDPIKPVCPYELAGGICNDNECDGQHFRAMGLSADSRRLNHVEDKVLVQLGIVNPGRTEEEQTEWRAGLKQVLKQLREQNVKNAESVASAITEYRREFLKDPSRVLNL
ncbi:uncharacterized protein K452DRAFT_360700 [Aplosporella prunicola CBS 121167]|uniref:Putative zinc-finger domain-containing protein n=1 Tax=Aplosporella prunicola CBS 121167 TaxID=1176127 RepID=A0A6A6B6S5_9PEZI|nr:uncharacterized protein K452DRAFT_360700 [Aplosporella prunicola CBS 121167]KAF2138934.1 hypothetical protein K452DRAFT_360700 [Aplosporella prunicola CBS 121167]